MYNRLFFKRTKLKLIFSLFTSLFVAVTIVNATPSKTVAIVQIIEHPALNATRQGIIDTLQKKIRT